RRRLPAERGQARPGGRAGARGGGGGAARRAHRPARPRARARGRGHGEGRWPALAHELPREAAELYQRLGTALETSGDYGGAHEALTTAVGLCRTGDADALEHGCLSCVAYVLRELGDWDRSAALCHEPPAAH